MRFIRQHRLWDFILGQSSHTYFREPDEQWYYLGHVIMPPEIWTKKSGMLSSSK